MDNTQDAIAFLRHYKVPYWRLMNGSAKVGESNTDNLEQSIADFETAVRFLQNGHYKLKAADKPDKYNGAFEFNYQKGGAAAAPSSQPAMNQALGPSTNAYGIPDAVLMKIQEETKRTLLFEQMHQQFGPMADLVKDIDKRLKKIEDFLKDEDSDGTPDIFEMAGKVADTAKKAGEVKKIFSGSSVFGD